MKKRKSSALRDLLDRLPISETRAFELAQVHRTTWRRWLDGTSTPPAATLHLLRLAGAGEIPDPAFSGFRVVRGMIYDEAGQAISPEDLRELPYLRQQVSRYYDLLRATDAKKAAPVAQGGPKLRLVR